MAKEYKEELEAVKRVFKSGVFSGYLAGKLTGGYEVEALEREWEEYFNVKHAIAVNSATSGLYCACNSGIFDESVDEYFNNKNTIFTTPFSMSATVSMPMVNNNIKFIDIEDDYYCMKHMHHPDIDYNILAVDLFGQPHDSYVNFKNNVIEDASQAIGAKYKDQYAGTLGKIGIFSLNYHKHIHCGEGVMIVTNDTDLAKTMRLIRNHGENVSRTLGFNFRLTEIQAAIAREQLKKLSFLIEQRVEKVNYFLDRLENYKNIIPPQTRPECTHVYYLVPLRILHNRNKYIKLLKENNIPHSVGYNKPLHTLPMFKAFYYSMPVAEKMYKELICLSITDETSKAELNKIVEVFNK